MEGQNVPCWMLDSDYDGMCFYATQVFFPKTSAWDNLQNSIKASFEESVWAHLDRQRALHAWRAPMRRGQSY